MNRTQSPLANWLPYHLSNNGSDFTCKWLFTNGVPLTGPFFTESMAMCMAHPHNSSAYKPLSNISLLPGWSTNLNSVAPTAFIFHVSRCGSTLISQSLSLNDTHIVLPEAPFIDEVLRLTKTHSNLDPEELVKATIRIYGQNPTGSKKHLFIKTDSWHIHFMPLLRKLYPTTPFILLYRKPDEVIRSHQKLRGMQAVPGVVPNEFLGLGAQSTNLDDHMVKVLERYFEALIGWSDDPLSLLVNYNEGILNIMKRFCNFTGLNLTANDWQKIGIRSGFNAKHPYQPFHEVQPEFEIPDNQKNVFKSYRALEVLRLAQADLK